MHTKARSNIKRLYSIVAIVVALLPLYVSAQPLDTRRQVDKLSFWDRLSIRTNGTDWLLMVPNIGVEFDLRNTNWSRYAVNVNLRYRPGVNTKLILPIAYEMKEVKVEGRMYWRERQAQADGPLRFHYMPWHKLMSCRRMVPKHPNTVFYRGVYASYGDYAFRLTGDGHRGTAVQAGITWGFVKPLYAFSNGNSIDFELGISGGIAFAKDNRFNVDKDNNVYNTTSQGDWKFVKMPVVNDIHAALVYRLGKYPIQKKYRWRYDVDMDYRARIDSAWLMRDRNRALNLFKDSVYKVTSNDFRETYDSVVNERHKERQERIDMSAPKRKTYVKVKREDLDKVTKNVATKKED